MLTEQELESFYISLSQLADDFPEEHFLQDFLDESVESLLSEKTDYRPSYGKNAGSLLDFTFSDFSSLPVIIVPDIHGRVDFLLHILKFKLPECGLTVLEALNEKKVIVVCVGDAVHSESRGIKRWLSSYADWSMDVYAGPDMQKEMKENFAVWQILMKLKNTFTANFHFLKGNHENVMNETGMGNLAFKKFVQEGQMCCDFIRQVYGDVILHLISLWEKSLPLCAVFPRFCVSHAEPREVYTRTKLIRAKKDENVILGLTWTANDEVYDDTCIKNFRKLNPKFEPGKIAWVGGHRPVKDTEFYLRQNGAYLQIHNPDEENILFVKPSSEIDVKNIFSVR